MPAQTNDTSATAASLVAGGVLWLVRHAQPLVAPGICYGATDMPADEAATRAAAQALALLLPAGARVWHSPLQRCAQLARAVGALRPDLRSRSDPRLVEMDFGCWEGWRWADIPKDAIDSWTAQFATWRFGGRESVQELMDRVAGVWAESRAGCQPTVWITHAGVIRAAGLLAQGMAFIQSSAQWPADAPAFGTCLQLDYAPAIHPHPFALPSSA